MAGAFLAVVDVQKGFINRWTARVPDAVAALQANFARVLVTRFFNPPGSMHRKLIGWERFAPGSADTALAFTPRADAEIVDKPSYTIVTPALLDRLAAHNIVRVDLCGIATDNCILKSAVDLFEAGITPVVHAYACASHGGPDCHDCGVKLLQRFIGEAQVLLEPPG